TAMDKIATKAILREHALPVAEYTWLNRYEWERDAAGALQRVLKKLALPVFVKPANLGSSIGISRAGTPDELPQATEVARTYDRRILVEQAVEQAIEVNCAVIGNEDLTASVCEQPISRHQFLSFDDKYLTNAEAGMEGAERIIPAPISPELTHTIQELALAVFRAMDCRGLARIDF